MPNHCHLRAVTAGVILAVVLTAAAAPVAGAAAASPAKSTTAAAPTPVPPQIGDTKANLQKAFANEMNAKERYTTFAKQADREGYPAVAQLFRACATAEQVHADRIVHAIAVVGGEARVLLDRVTTGTTAENLQASIQAEDYEVNEFYPALLARAHADLEPEAVRGMTFALAAEREHGRLLRAALATLDQRPAPHPLYVCSYCGRTVETLDAGKCPTCFTSAAKFIRVGAEAQRAAATPAVPAPASSEKAKPPVTPLLRK